VPEIVILGSSSGDPSIDRANSSILIRHGGRHYQFDAGDGCASSIRRHEIDYSAIGTIFISHMHPDHITGLFLEIQMMFLARRRDPLTVYVPSEAMTAIDTFMKATYLFDEKMGFETRLRPIVPDPVFRDDNITVYARANSHLKNYEKIVGNAGGPNQLQSYSFIIKTDNARIIYSGDIASLDDYADLLPGCDVLITEGMHFDREDLFEMVAADDVGNLILTHLSDDMYRNPESIIISAQKHGVENLYLAKDGMVISV
jgi:ribonuclease Z